MKKVNKAIYLSVCEFYVLLMQQNIQGIAVFEEIRNDTPDEQELAQGVISLMEKKLLTASGNNSYQLSEEIETMLDILEKTKSTFVINGYLSSCPMQCCYFYANLCLILQMDDHREDFVRIEILDKSEAINGFLAYEFMPDTDVFLYEIEEEPDMGSKGELSALCLPESAVEDLLSDESVMMVIDRYARDSTVPDQRAVVCAIKEKDRFVVCTGRELHTEMFCSEAFTRFFCGGIT